MLHFSSSASASLLALLSVEATEAAGKATCELDFLEATEKVGRAEKTLNFYPTVGTGKIAKKVIEIEKNSSFHLSQVSNKVRKTFMQ